MIIDEELFRTALIISKMTTPTDSAIQHQPSSYNDTGNIITIQHDKNFRCFDNNSLTAWNRSRPLNETDININMNRVDRHIGTFDINTTMANRHSTSINNTNETITFCCLQNTQPGGYIDNNWLYTNNGLSTLEKNLILNQKTLDKMNERLSLYARATRKMKQRHHYKSCTRSNISDNGKSVTKNRLSRSSLAISENINLKERMTTNPDTSQDNVTEYDGTQREIQRATRRRNITCGNAGLRNQSVICYSNAILQAIASSNHITQLFNVILQDDKKCFKMNYEFVRLINTMICQSDCVDPGNFVQLFTNYHQEFKDNECKYY